MAAISLCTVVAVWATLSALGTAHAASNSIHRHMNADELRRTFQVDTHEQVPEYEVVRIRSFSKRSAPQEGSRNVRLSAFGRDLRLSLERAQGLLKDGALRVWVAETNSSDPGRVEYNELTQDEEDLGDAYQDESNQAALLLHKDQADGSLLMEGTIGSDLVMKPVPASVRQHLDDDDQFDDDEMFLDDEGEDIEADVAIETGFPLRRLPRSLSVSTHQHIVYKRNVQHHEDMTHSDYAFMEPDHLSKRFRSKRSINKREAPYVIYPEILVIVDYDGYRLHGGDNVQIKRYFVSFWNGVDLRYKLLKGPKIRISIAGIIISRGRDATPYLERNRVGRDAIDSAAALTDMGKYLFRERRLPVYDIAVAVTKLDMCRRQFANDVCNRGTAGFAYVGGACVVNKRLEKVNSVAIIEDTGGFSGIIVGAHEVGHLLGAVHDGSPPPSYLGGPGAEKCRWEDGYIMSDLRHTEKGFKWSSCSVASFHHFLNGDTATCLYNSPHEDESLPRVLPGKLLTLDAQCRKDRGTSACFKDDRVCAQLFCFDAGSGYCVAYRPAAEGSPCGDGQYCINGRCVAEHENIIPDYSQNTPSYIRRNDADSAATQSRPVYANPPNITTQRSPWNEFWSTRGSTTPYPLPSSTTHNYNPYYNASTTRKPYNSNHYYTSTTTRKPFNPYSTPSSTTKRTYQYYTSSTVNPYDAYFKAKNAVSSTKNPYDFSNFHKRDPNKGSNNQYYSSTTTKNPYAAFNYYSSTTPKPNPYSNYNAFHNPTTSTTKKYQSQYYSSATNNEPSIYNGTNGETTIVAKAEDTECVDKVTNMGGSMTCQEFLTRYGYQYCSYRYIHHNCCASHREICTASQRRRK